MLCDEIMTMGEGSFTEKELKSSLTISQDCLSFLEQKKDRRDMLIELLRSMQIGENHEDLQEHIF